MNSININCDVGEGINNEELLMPHIQYCNIACGGHIGDNSTMEKVVVLAKKFNVKIGAHPSYPDKENFGRKSIQIDEESLIESVRSQVESLIKIIANHGCLLYHIKPHGALYNDISRDRGRATIFLKAIEDYKENIKLFVPFNSEIETLAIEKGFSILYEAFADRNYNTDLSLVSRNNSNALLTKPAAVIKHTHEMVVTQKVTTISGEKVPIKADTYCVHSDTKNAEEIVKKLNQLSNKMS